MVGDEAATAIQIVFNICISGIMLYIIIVQLIRLLVNFNNRNSEDQKARQEARDNIKASAFIIVMVTLIGGVGFTALSFFVLSGDLGIGQ
jgi:hypothetical protein